MNWGNVVLLHSRTNSMEITKRLLYGTETYYTVVKHVKFDFAIPEWKSPKYY